MAIVMAASQKRMNQYFKREVRGPAFKGNEEMGYEGVRLKTYKDWPKWGAVWPTLLARAGFYYTGTADQVACFCCDGRLKSWESGDSPMTEHKRFFPRCRFVTGRDSTNVPLGEAAKEHLCITAPGDCRQSEPPSVVRLSAAGLGQQSVPVSVHNLQDMMLERTRLKSFSDWPTSAYACSETFAKTLVSIAIADHIGAAGNVSTGDTNANIQQLSQNGVIYSSPTLPSHEHNRSNYSGNTPGFHYQGPCEFHVADQVRARMDTARVQCVLRKGYSYKLVYDVIKHRLTATGDDFHDMNSLMGAVLAATNQNVISPVTASSRASEPTATSCNEDAGAAARENQETTLSARACVIFSKLMSLTCGVLNKDTSDGSRA